MAVDGTIKINTKIDQSGVQSGLVDIESSCKKTAKGIGDTFADIPGVKFDKNGRARDEMGRFLSMAQKAKLGIKDSTGSMNADFSRLGGVIAGVFAGVSLFEFGKAALKSTADIELAQVKLETMLGSSSRAQSMIADIVKMADTTPYNSQELIQAATTMKTFGISAQEILPTLTALGNAAGGQGEQLAGLARALGQTRAQGKMMTQDLYQFVNAGVPLLGLLAKQMRKTTGEISQMIEAGQIGYPEVDAALKKFYTGTGEYAGLMAKSAQTLPGMFSTMQDAVSSFGREIVATFEPTIKSLMTTITDAATAAKDFIQNMSPDTKAQIVEYVNLAVSIAGIIAVVLAVKSAFMLLIPILNGAKFAFMVLNAVAATNPYLVLAAGLAVLAAAFAEPIMKMTIFRKEFDDLAESGRALSTQAQFSADQQLKYNGHLDETIKKRKLDDAQATKWLSNMRDFNAKLLQMGILPSQVKGIREMNAEIDKLLAKKEKKIEAKASTADQLKAIKEQEKLQEDYDSWVIDKQAGAYEQQQYLLDRKYQKELAAAKGYDADGVKRVKENLFLVLELEKKHLDDRESLRRAAGEKAVTWSSILGNLLGAGSQKSIDHIVKLLDSGKIMTALVDAARDMGATISRGVAEGLDEGLFVVTHAVKGMTFMIGAAFEGAWSLFEGAFSILDWMSDFKPADLMVSFKGFLDGINDFFMNDIGSLPIFFDSGLKMVTELLDGLTSNLPSIVASIGNVISHVATALTTQAPKLIQQFFTIAGALIEALVNGLYENADAIVDTIGLVIDQLCTFLITKAPALISKALAIAFKLAMKVVEKLPEIFNAMMAIFLTALDFVAKHASELARGMTNALVQMMIITRQHLPEITVEGLKISSGIVTGIVQGLSDSLAHTDWLAVAWLIVVGMVRAIPQMQITLATAYYECGRAVVSGVTLGVVNIGTEIWNVLSAGFTWMYNAVLDFFGIHSPSKLFADIGVNVVLGMIEGIGDIGQTLWDAINDGLQNLLSLGSDFLDVGSQLGAAIFDGIKNAFSSLSSWFSGMFQNIFNNLNFGSVIDAIKNAIGDIVPDIGGGGGGSAWYNPTSWFADGTDNAPGGLAVVGERGAELVNLPKGSQVIPHPQTMSMLKGLSGMQPTFAGSQGSTISLNNNITGSVTIDGQRLAEIVFTKIDKIIKARYGI